MFMPQIRRFFRDAKGSVLPIVGIGLVALATATGVGVDTARSQMLQARLQQSLDTSALAAGANASTANVVTVVNKYMAANFNNNSFGATVTNVTATLSSDQSKITASATASMPTSFMKVVGKTQITVSAQTEITRASKGMELVMVLDTTGSMAGSKLTSLKTASNDLLDILFGQQATATNLWVGIVPFSQSVNIGPTHTNWLDTTYYNTLNWGPTSWAGCVDARASTNRDTTDDPPSVEKFKAYYWANNSNYNYWINSNGTYRSISSTQGPNKYCPSEVTRMTNVRATLNSGINALVAQGNTLINYGMVWGWRMISPRWRGQWGGTMDTNNLPLDYNTPLMNKVAILMTDGDNTMSNSVDSAYGYLSQGTLGSTNATTAEASLDTRLGTVCTAMKAQGILVYTILFDNAASTNAQNILKNCASNPDYFFNSPTEAELQTAFKTIGDSLANLRISK